MLNGMQAEKPSQAMDQQCRARRQHPSIYHPTHHPPSPDGAGTHTALFQGAAALVIGLPYGGVAAMDPRSNPDSVWEHPFTLIPITIHLWDRCLRDSYPLSSLGVGLAPELHLAVSPGDLCRSEIFLNLGLGLGFRVGLALG